MADISLTSSINIGISINPLLSALPILSSNIHAASISYSLLDIGINTILNGSSISTFYINSIPLEIGHTETLSGSSNNISLIESLLIFGSDEFLTKTINIQSNINVNMIVQIKCSNCRFNTEKKIIKYSPGCFRTGRYNNNKLNCNMYMLKTM